MSSVRVGVELGVVFGAEIAKDRGMEREAPGAAFDRGRGPPTIRGSAHIVRKRTVFARAAGYACST
jgi:hypothetical protein